MKIPIFSNFFKLGNLSFFKNGIIQYIFTIIYFSHLGKTKQKETIG